MSAAVHLTDGQIEVPCPACGAWNPTGVRPGGIEIQIGTLNLAACVECGEPVKVTDLRWPPVSDT